MVWIRIDDQIAHHPKFIAAGPVASWLWVCGNGYCNKYLTDGFIPTTAVRTLGGVTNAPKWADRLADVGLWDRVDGGYRVHDFHDFNPSAADIKAKRATRAAAGKAGAAARWPAHGKGDGKSHSTPHDDRTTTGMPPSRPVLSRPIQKEPDASDARTKRPIFTGQRLVVFEWMLDDHMKILGTHADSFDLHEWYFALDTRMLREDVIQPKRDSGAWVESELVAEARRRGLPLRIAAAPAAGKQTTRLATAVANIAREGA